MSKKDIEIEIASLVNRYRQARFLNILITATFLFLAFGIEEFEILVQFSLIDAGSFYVALGAGFFGYTYQTWNGSKELRLLKKYSKEFSD